MIDWNLIDIPNGKKGEVQTICPACSHNRKKSKDKCLSVNVEKGVARCHHCEEFSIREVIERKEYKSPPQQWQNFTSLSEPLVKWFKGRGISQNTLIECKITEEAYYQPSKQSECNNVVFNYFEGEKLLNKKFRSADKKFTQCKDAKKVFYGLNDIVGEKEIYIVEGEMDKLAMWEVGIRNCISVPNGANDLNDVIENCENYIKDLDKIYICVDMDEPGVKLEKEIVKRFGKWRCERVEFIGKDANDDLISDRLQLEKTISQSKPYPVDGTFTANDISDEIDDLYFNGMEETIKPKGEDFKKFNEIFSILMGQLTVVTGIPSHGKSNWLEWYLINLISDNDLKASFYSPEHLPMKLHHSQLAEKVVGKPFRGDYNGFSKMTHDELNQYKDWSSERVFITNPEKGEMIGWDWLIEKFKEQIFRFGVDVFVIDAFNKVKRNSPSDLAEIGEILGRLTLFVQAYNVHIFLVAHPTKMKKDQDGVYEIPSLYDVKGSGDFRDQAHNGLCIYRYFDENNEENKAHTLAMNIKTKFKHQGEIGENAKFVFEPANGRYRDIDSGLYVNSLAQLQEVEKFPTNGNAIEFDKSMNEILEEHEEQTAPF